MERKNCNSRIQHGSVYHVKALLLILILGLSHSLVRGQNPDRTFLWDKGDSGHGFWNKAINCGRASQPGGANNTKGSKVTFGVTKERRFPGSFSVEYWTNSNYQETCNQNFTAERAEMSAGGSYRGLGVKEGSTVWVGWSELWKEVDETHSATVMQFRSNCGSGSPATEIYMRPGRVLQLRVANGKRLNLYSPNINQWYDMVVEIKYSKSNNGYVNIWYKKASDSQYQKKSFTNIPTMKSGDNCPHMRWGGISLGFWGQKAKSNSCRRSDDDQVCRSCKNEGIRWSAIQYRKTRPEWQHASSSL